MFRKKLSTLSRQTHVSCHRRSGGWCSSQRFGCLEVALMWCDAVLCSFSPLTRELTTGVRELRMQQARAWQHRPPPVDGHDSSDAFRVRRGWRLLVGYPISLSHYKPQPKSACSRSADAPSMFCFHLLSHPASLHTYTLSAYTYGVICFRGVVAS